MAGTGALVDEIVAQGRGDHPALLLDDGSKVSYRELSAGIDATAREFAAAGLGRGQRVVLVGENSADIVVALFAAIRAGAWAVPLNARMSATEIAAICGHCEPRLVYYASASSAEAAAHAERRGAGDARATLQQLPQGRLQACTGAGTAADGSDDVAVMIYTSGSTGLPKGVMLTHANLDFVTRASLQQEVLLPDDVIFHALPISHSFGLVSGLLCGLRAGATLRLVGRFSAPVLAEAIASGEITAFQGVPAMYARLHEWCQQQGRTLVPNRLRMLYIGGSLIDATRKAQTEALLGLRLHHGYGLTESAPAATRTIGHAPPRDITAGWPIPGIEVEVQDPSGQALAAGERGEVCIRGPNVMKGYFRDPLQTRAAIDERGWLHTGDIGFFGPDGDLSIAGRSKEMIIRGGFNVYPAEIERAIAEFPGIAQCAVVGRSVPGDEEVVAYLEPVAGRTVDTLALKAFLRARLAPYKVPTAIVSLAQLPATGTGKLLKARLKEMADAEVAKAMTAPVSRDLQALLRPASIAVVGASDNSHKVGGRPLQYLAQQGFRGRVYPVNPRAERIQGLQAYASLDALPEVPEAVILCVGSDAVEAQLTLCANLGVRAVVLFASGYAELGAQGHVEQQRLAEICRRGGMRLLGPNSIGVASFDSGAVLSFASIYADCEPKDGPVAIVSQSGAFGVSVYALLREAGVGVRCVAATGNEADLDTSDFIVALVQRPGVRLILLYLEHVGDPRRMRAALETARRRGVCVVAVRAGRSADGRRSAGLHTGSAGAANDELDALFADGGCRTVADMGEMLRCVPGYLQASDAQRVAAQRLVIISNSGAACVIAADEASRTGMPLARLSPASQARLGELLPDFSLNRNPIDLTAMLLAKPSLLGDVMQCAMADPAAHCVVLGLLAIGGPSYDVQRFARDCRAAAHASGKPLWVYSPHPRVRQAFSDQGLPVFAGEAEALREIVGHAEHLRALAPPAIPSSEAETLHA